MTALDWLLIMLKPGADAPGELDPIRIQKGMFYFSREATLPADQKYEFAPYYYGPCSFTIYRDIEALQEGGLVEEVPVPGRTWKRYSLTDEGTRRAAALASAAPPEALETCARARSRVVQHTFQSLLREVYEEYPEYASRSVANLP